MTKKSAKLTILLPAAFVLMSAVLFAQAPDPQQIIDKVKAAFDKVKDYEVDVSIKIEVDFMDVPDGTAKIYFKQPDKVTIKSKDFALMPREGLNFSPASLLKGKYTAVWVREESLSGFATHQIKIVPLDNNSEFILSTIWVDKYSFVIRKVETTTKAQGTFSMTMTYPLVIKYPLPSTMSLYFDIKQGGMMKNMPGKKKKGQIMPAPQAKQGKVFITYMNYKVNRGLSDSLFEEKK